MTTTLARLLGRRRLYPKDPSLNFRLPPELLEALGEVAIRNDISRSAVLRLALARFLRAVRDDDELIANLKLKEMWL